MHTQCSYTFGTWNVCGLSKKKRVVFAELRRENEDVVVLTETKLRGVGQEEYGNYTHIYSGISTGAPRAGVSILLKKEIACDFKWESVSERIIKAELKIRGRDIDVIGVYWVDECAKTALKDSFQSSLKSVVENVDPNHELILLGDFNSKVGTDANSRVVGSYGDSEINNNGRRLIELCKDLHLKIQNTFFNHEDKHKYTWYHSRRSRRSVIDFCITRQNSSLFIEDVVACRWLECGTDHIFLEATLFFPQQEEDIIELRKYRTYMLYSKSIRNSYKEYLETAIDLSVPRTTEDMYQYLKNNIHSAAFDVLGTEKENKFGEFLWDKEIRDFRAFREVRRNPPETEQVYLEGKFNESQLKSIKNEVWEGMCSAIDNADKYRRNKVIWNILGDLQNKTSRRTYGDEFIYEAIRRHDRSESTEHSVNNLSNFKEPHMNNLVDVNIADVCKALDQLEDCNNSVPGGLRIQLLRYSSHKAKTLLRNLIQNIFNGDRVPKEITEMHCIDNPRVGDEILIPHRGKCSMHSIMRVMRLILKNILENCSSFEDTHRVIPIEPHLNVTFILRQILQKSAEKQISPFHIVFLDLGNTFFDIDFSKLFEVLGQNGIPNELIEIIKHLYEGNNIRILELGKRLETFYSIAGLTYDFSLSCTLLKMYIKQAVKDWSEENLERGIMIGNERLLFLFLKDSKLVIVSENKRNMQTIITSLKRHLEKIRLRLNFKNLKYLSKDNLEIDCEIISGKEIIKFHDSVLELDGRNIEEISQRILDTKEAIGALHPVARDGMISKRNKKRIFNSIIRSLLLYCCETWTITKDLKKPFEDTELSYWKWCCENYPQRYTKPEIYDLMDVKEGISRIIMLKKAAWYTSILQMENQSWTKNVLDWEPEGILKCGRPRKKWLDDVEEFLNSMSNYQIYFQKSKQLRRSNIHTSLSNYIIVHEKNEFGDTDDSSLYSDVKNV